MTQPNYMNFTRFSQFQKLRKTDPQLYNSPAFQMAMHKLAEKYGEQFFETPLPQGQLPDTSSIASPPVSELDRREKIEALQRHIQELQEAEISTSEGGDTNGQ